MIPPDQNPLEYRYTFWLSKRKSVLKGKNYDQSMMKLGSFDTVQQFWRYYSFMKRPSKVDEACDLMLVRIILFAKFYSKTDPNAPLLEKPYSPV